MATKKPAAKKMISESELSELNYPDAPKIVTKRCRVPRARRCGKRR